MLPSGSVYTRSDAEWLELLREAPTGIIPGDAERILEQSQEIFRILQSRGIVKEGDRILDLGCGIGRIAIPLTRMDVSYDGIDIVPACIRFCRRTFRPWTHFVFRVLHVRNRKYRKIALRSPRAVRLPYPNQTFDCAIAISVFTHIGDPIARDRYISELARVLRDNGQAFVTWFRSPPNAPCNDDERTVFAESEIESALAPHFDIIESWGGTTESRHDQWVMHLKKKPQR